MARRSRSALANGGTFVTAITIFGATQYQAALSFIEQRLGPGEAEKRRDRRRYRRRKASRCRKSRRLRGGELASRPGQLRKSASGRLFACTVHRGGLPEPGSRRDRGSIPWQPRRFWQPTIGRRARPIPSLDTFRPGILLQSYSAATTAIPSGIGKITLNALLLGWTRFPPAQEWLNRNKAAAP